MPPSKHPLRLLLLDDDAVVTELLAALLALEGHTVSSAASGEDALSLLQISTDPLDLVLTDLHLPGLSGLDLLQALRSAAPPATLLFGMSGSQPGPDILQHLDHFLLKPFEPSAFIAAFAEVSRQQTRPPAASSAAETLPPRISPLDENIYSSLAAALPPPQLREIYTLTLTDAAQRIDRIHAAEALGDTAAVHREAHALKGGTGMVGATELHLLAAQKEKGSLEDTPPIAELHAACDRLRSMLDARLS